MAHHPYQASFSSSTDTLLPPSTHWTTKTIPIIQKIQTRRRRSNIMVNDERRVSYGIGGAGNIRRPSEVLYKPKSATSSERNQHRWSSFFPFISHSHSHSHPHPSDDEGSLRKKGRLARFIRKIREVER